MLKTGIVLGRRHKFQRRTPAVMLEAFMIAALAIKMDGPLEEAPPSGGGHFDADDGGLEDDAGGTSVVMHTWQRTNVASAHAGGGDSE